MFGRRKIATLVAEFLGTGVLTLLILSVQRSTIGVPFFVAAAAGLTLAMLTFVLGPTSGANFNPALTIGMWTARKISTLSAILYVVVQVLGAWAAYALYTYFVNATLQKVGGHFTGRILVAEAVGSGVFAFGWAAAYYRRSLPAGTAAFSGLAYMIGIVAASSAAIGLLNPAVAFGVRAFVWGTYVAGPVLGAIIGVNLYSLLFDGDTNLVTASATETLVETVVVAPPASESAVTKKPRATKTVTKRKTTTRRKA